MYISPYCRSALEPLNFMKFGMRGHLTDAITCVKFLVNRFRDYGVLTSRKWPFPIDLLRRPYNSSHCRATLWNGDFHQKLQNSLPLLFNAPFWNCTEPGLGHWKEFFFVFTHVRVNSKYVRKVIRTCVKFTYVRIPMYKQMLETVSLYVNIWACT